jgi:predicted  nucleic acid-binding Zn-ribbon protein
MNIEETLSNLKHKIDSINTKRIENQTRLHSLEQEKLKLLEECQRLGVDPSQLETIVASEEAKLNEELSKFETQVGTVYNEINKF